MAAASPAFSVSSPSADFALGHLQPGLAALRQGMDRLDTGIQLRRPDFRILHQPHFIFARIGRGDAGEMVAHRFRIDASSAHSRARCRAWTA